MWNSKDVYYVSDSIGILVANMGKSLLCQFPEVNFHEENFPLVRTAEEAEEILRKIIETSGGRSPLIFTTIVDPAIRKIFDHPEVEFFDLFGPFLDRLEKSLECKALHLAGYFRQPDEMTANKRVEAIHYCLEHDDGTKSDEYNEADVIILGVSRAGKTPVSVYLATQLGYKTANFPLTSEYLEHYQLPQAILPHLHKAVAITTSAGTLAKIRQKRYPDSNYASIATCREEIQKAEQIYQSFQIPTISSNGKSIEELATQITKMIKNQTREDK